MKQEQKEFDDVLRRMLSAPPKPHPKPKPKKPRAKKAKSAQG